MYIKYIYYILYIYTYTNIYIYYMYTYNIYIYIIYMYDDDDDDDDVSQQISGGAEILSTSESCGFFPLGAVHFFCTSVNTLAQLNFAPCTSDSQAASRTGRHHAVSTKNVSISSQSQPTNTRLLLQCVQTFQQISRANRRLDAHSQLQWGRAMAPASL